MANMANRVDPGGPIDYYQALYGHEAARVPLSDGGTLTLIRPSLGPSYHMDALGVRITHEPPAQRVGYLREWLAAGGVEEPDRLTLADIIKVAGVLQSMLPSRGSLPFQLPQPQDPDPEAPAIEYSGRELAVIVHSLAEAYGWDLAQILALPREVALAQAQEILITDRRRREWEHMLSEVAWGYNKTTGKSEYKPLPPPSWEAQPVAPVHPPVPEEIREKYDPKGVIVDLTKSRRKAGNAHEVSAKFTQPGPNGDTNRT